MSEIGLNINVDSYNNEGIKTIKGNNNAEIYKLYILKNKRRLSLVGKTVKLGYVMAGTTKGDIIENLNITNVEQGEITFPITNRISKQDGVYSCQLAIYGADGFLEHTAKFGLTVEANIFTKIAGEIADSKDFTYLENILDKASKLSEKLKENTSSATNANSNLESNITEANNINSKLLENTSTATSLNKNLESNIDLAKEVKETIKDLDNKNIEATEKIETLTGLNAKATELSNNIQQALPLNSELVKNTESAKVANTNLLTTNQEAVSKNTELQASLEKTKEFIEGLDGSQNIPQIRMDVTELQNGLKSNQALSYEGSSISADNTLEGRTEGMVIKGKTSIIDGQLKSFGESEQEGDKYKISILSHGKNLFNFKSIKEEAFDNNSIKLLENGLRIENHWAKSIDFKIDLKPNTKYTSSYNYKVIKDAVNPTDTGGGKLMLHNESTGKYFALTNPKGVGMTFTTPEDIKDYKKIILYSAGGGGSYRGIVEITNIQIEEGTQATQCEAYKEDKKNILIKEPLSEWDTMYEDNGQVKVSKTAYQGALDGENEDWIVWANSTGDTVNAYVYFNRMTPNLSKVVKPNSICINDRLPSNQGGYLSTKEGFKVTSEYFAISIHKSKLGVTNVNDPNNSTLIKKWLKANPITFVCQRATPVVEVVDGVIDIDLDTYQEKTYFSIENSLPGTLDFKVPSNIGSVVQNMAKEVNNIWDVINNLLVPGILDVNKKVALATIKNNLK